MTLLGMILTTAISLVVIAVSFYIGKLVGYFKGIKSVYEAFGSPLTSYMGDTPGFLKKKEEENGKSSKS